ncbi:MAG TPA: dihydropteroate synthase [Candidatus Saccharimonadales bacterium]|nr:dihydropteroate synthase [Candidatus Saccharimonadales bacterium]
MSGTPHAILNPTRPFTLLGVVNTTPDSFYDGGQFFAPGDAIARGLELRAEGADWIDVGGESTRPGAEPVSPAEEVQRVLPVVRALVSQGIPVSIDTRRARVAAAALDAGAQLVNDVSALADPDMAELAAGRGAAVLLMHMQGTPKTMQEAPVYADVVAEVRAFLAERVAQAVARGIARERLAVDPGIGFGKTLAHNLQLLGGLRALTDLGVPVAVGVSRKSFLGAVTGAPPSDRLAGSLAAAVCAYLNGARIFRVHDVKATRDALAISEAVRRHGSGP